jgi:hypothetical protein
MARYTGLDLYISFKGVSLQTDKRTFTVNEAIDQADSSAGTSIDRTHILTQRGAEFSLEYLETLGSAGSALRTALALGGSGTLIYAPEGTATGKPRYACIASVVGLDRAYPFEDVVTVTANFVKNGEWIAHYEHLASVF